MASAYNAYSKSTDTVERGVALFIIGRDYDRHDKQKEGLAAFDAGLKLTPSPSVAERAEQLRRLVPIKGTTPRTLRRCFAIRYAAGRASGSRPLDRLQQPEGG